MKKKVLIVCKYFAPNNSIASVRPTKIGKYLSKLGNKVDVVITNSNIGVEDPTLKKDLVYFENVYNLFSTKEKIVSIKVKDKNKLSRDKIFAKIVHHKFSNKLFKILRVHFVYLFFLLQDYKVSKIFKKTIIELEKYDFVFTTYGPHSSHYIGRFIKKRNRSIKWIADFRDPVYQKSVPFLFKRYARNFVRKVCKEADLITSASTEQIKDLNLGEFMKSKTVYNGFDKDDISLINLEIEPSTSIRLCYTGTIYEAKQDYTPIFRAISELIFEGKVKLHQIEFIYAGNDFFLLQEMAKDFSLEKILINKGYVSRDKALEIQASSDLLVIGAWKNETENMSLAGKFFEYLNFDLPVLGVVSGNKGDSELKYLIDNTFLGFCYEEASSEKDFNQMKVFIREIYQRKLKLIEPKELDSKSLRSKFSYEEIAKDLLESLI